MNKDNRKAFEADADRKRIFATQLGEASRRLARALIDAQRSPAFVDSLGEALHDYAVAANAAIPRRFVP
jgi:hypothetical protein